MSARIVHFASSQPEAPLCKSKSAEIRTRSERLVTCARCQRLLAMQSTTERKRTSMLSEAKRLTSELLSLSVQMRETAELRRQSVQALRDFGFSLAEIAEAMNVTRSAVQKMLVKSTRAAAAHCERLLRGR